MTALSGSLPVEFHGKISRLTARLEGSGDWSPGAVISLLGASRHPNSIIARFKICCNGAETTVFAKWLLPDEPDGRANRSDRCFKEAQVRSEYETLRRMEAALAGNPRCAVVHPVAYYADELCLVTEEHVGDKLAEALKGARRFSRPNRLDDLLLLMQSCGEWLRVFQDCFSAPANVSYDPKQDVEYCRVRLQILEERRFLALALSAKILRAVEQNCAGLPVKGQAIAGLHNDYSPVNILVSGNRIIVLDLAGFSYGPREADAIRFWLYLETMRNSVLYRADTVSSLQSRFLAGYGSQLDKQDPLWLILHTGFVLDKLADILVDWADLSLLRRPSYRRLLSNYREWLHRQFG